MEAESDQILKVTLERPVPYFLQLISQRPFVPVNQKAIGQFGKQWTQPGKLVSNGAYKLVNWVPNERIEAERNVQYWMMPTPDPAGDLPAARLTACRAAALRGGEIQLTNKVALEYYQKTKEATPSGSGDCRYWAPTYTFNLRRPELQDVRCARRWP